VLKEFQAIQDLQVQAQLVHKDHLVIQDLLAHQAPLDQQDRQAQ
jgi:hypothetical protein